MALPPERITVKRRRDEDPIEALYIQPKKYRPSAVWTLAGDENDKPAYADPVASSRIPGELQPSQSLDPKVPTVRTTLPSEDVSREPHVPTDPDVPNPKIHTLSKPIVRPVTPGQHDKESAIEPRKFHLAKSSLPVSSPYLVSKTPAQKHRKIRRRELAVFVEKTGKIQKAKPTRSDQGLGDGIIAELRDGEGKSIVGSEVIRKRPSATSAERKWRSENWDKRGIPASSTGLGIRTGKNVNDPSHHWDYESPELAEQLQQVAFQETRARQERSSHLDSPPQLKNKPKPPKPRRPAAQRNAKCSDEDDAMADVVAFDDDNDYVFDTYVRSNAHPAGMIDAAEPLPDPLQDVDHHNMGLLVIEEGEDEELWETFGEDLDSDSDFNSEEEDENSENFYGNDYPEDEVNSDDEFGRGAYNYRHGASDDEEFDEQEPSWSDEESDAKRPWTLNREHPGIGLID